MDITLHISNTTLYILIVVLSALLRYPLARLHECLVQFDNYSGSPVHYAPGIKKEHSYAYSAGFNGWNKRQLIVTWIIFPLIPFYWGFQVWAMLLYLVCRTEYFLTYGKDAKKYQSKHPDHFN